MLPQKLTGGSRKRSETLNAGYIPLQIAELPNWTPWR